MKLSEKLLDKIKKQFPQIINHQNENLPLRAVRGLDDGCRFKWSNGHVGELHIFSYSTMKECLDQEIFLQWGSRYEGCHGWEIYIK